VAASSMECTKSRPKEKRGKENRWKKRAVLTKEKTTKKDQLKREDTGIKHYISLARQEKKRPGGEDLGGNKHELPDVKQKRKM